MNLHRSETDLSKIDTPTLRAEWQQLFDSLEKAAPADKAAIQSRLDDLDEELEYRAGLRDLKVSDRPNRSYMA